jgi:hypothetical protein
VRLSRNTPSAEDKSPLLVTSAMLQSEQREVMRLDPLWPALAWTLHSQHAGTFQKRESVAEAKGTRSTWTAALNI